MPVIDPSAAPFEASTPEDDDRLGAYHWFKLGDAGGLTQFGANLQTLEPGSWSSDAHWHEEEDEFVYVTDGTVTLHETFREGERVTDVPAGGAIAFRAGDPVGHTLENRSDRPATFLVIGTRAARDVIHYTRRDRIATRTNGVRVVTDRQGRPVAED